MGHFDPRVTGGGGVTEKKKLPKCVVVEEKSFQIKRYFITHVEPKCEYHRHKSTPDKPKDAQCSKVLFAFESTYFGNKISFFLSQKKLYTFLLCWFKKIKLKITLLFSSFS